MRPAVSVQPPEQQRDFESTGVVDQLHGEYSMADLLPDYHGGHMDSFAFTDGAHDGSFNTPLDFTFDDFINDSASLAVDAQASGAV